MRVAAVQLESTDSKERNLEAAERLVRDAAADGCELVVLPERLDIRGTAADYAAGAEDLDGRPVRWARALAARARHRPRGRLGGRAARGARAGVEHVRARRSGRRAQGRLPQDPHVRRGGGRGRVPRVRALGACRRDRAVRDRRRHPARPLDLLRPALSRAVPDPGASRRAHRDHPGQLHARDRRGPLGGARPRSGDREPGVRGGAGPGSQARPRGRQLRQLDDRGPVGRGARPRAGRGRARDRRGPRPGPPGRAAREAAEPGQPRERGLPVAGDRARAARSPGDRGFAGTARSPKAAEVRAH